MAKVSGIRIVACASASSSKTSFAKDGSKKGSDLNPTQASCIASTVTQAAARVQRTCAKLQIFLTEVATDVRATDEQAADDAELEV